MSREVKLLEKEIEKLERFDPADESKARYEGIVKGLNEALNLVKSVEIELNENQQIVLEWLKWSVNDQGNSSMDAVYLLVLGETLVSVSLAYIALTPDQQTQVLAVFSKEVAK